MELVYKKSFFEMKVFYFSCWLFFFTCTEKIQFLDMILNATLFLENDCFQHECQLAYLFSFLWVFSFFIATLFLYLTLYLCIFDKPVASAMPINSPSKSMMLFNRKFFASKQTRNFFFIPISIDYVIWQNLFKTILLI